MCLLAALIGTTVIHSPALEARPGIDPQTPAAQSPTPPAPPPEHRVGGFVPGQKRAPEDPAQIARGKTLYEVNCRGCHGQDLRGGDMGGPNLLRSQVALSDLHGELIVPIIEGSRKNMGMPNIGLSIADANAAAAFVRSVIEMIGQQGTPPSAGREAPSILVGNAELGKAYFAKNCAGCHSATGDLQGIAAKFSDPKRLQTAWVSGRSPGGQEQADSARAAMASVSLPSGEKVEGKLLQIDDFLISLQLADGTVRSFQREGDVPTVVVSDPMKKHRELMEEYTDKDMHDVTAFLVTLK